MNEIVPSSKNLLWNYIKKNFNIRIPRVHVCKDHVAPFDFMWDAFINKYKTFIVKANRSGGKTMDFALLDVLDALANNECEVATLGAIKSQSLKCYRYIQDFIRNQSIAERITSSLLSRTNFSDKSSIEILTATISGVNSPHPQKLTMDEVELIAWFILQQAFNMVQSKGDIVGRTILGSTQKFVGGPMEKLLNDARKTGRMGVYEWCIWEVMEKPDLEQVEELKRIFGDDLPANILDCDGYYKWEDLIERKQQLDSEIFDTEILCKRPQSGGLIYPRFTDDNNLCKDFVLDPRQVYLFEDYGYAITHPDVVLFTQVDQKNQRVILFDEVYSSLKNTSEIIAAVKQKLQGYGLDINTIRGWIGDPHGLTETQDRYNAGCPMITFEKMKEEYPELNITEFLRVRNGIALVRKFVDMGWLKFTPNMTDFRNEMMSYRKVKGANGEYKDEPDKKLDHGPDALRYGLLRLFVIMAVASFDVMRPRAAVPASILPPSRPITAGLMSKKF